MTDNKLIFAVGSTNRAKIKAVEDALEIVFPNVPKTIVSIKAVSGVRDQPLSDKESIEGATNRAKQAIKEANADYGIASLSCRSSTGSPFSSLTYFMTHKSRSRHTILQWDIHIPLLTLGLEGGIDKIGDVWFQCGWIVVVDKDGRIGVGSSARYQLSDVILKPLLEEGKELAEVMDAITGLHDVRSDQGAMGILTNGLLPRAKCYQHGIIFAFAPWISDVKYWAQSSSQ